MRRRLLFSQDTKEAAVNRFFETDVTAREIAVEVGCAEGTLRNWIHLNGKKLGHTPRPIGRFSTDVRQNAVRRYLETDETAREIAADVGCALSVLWDWIHQYRVGAWPSMRHGHGRRPS